MARNPTPLIVPCHRVVSVRGLGVFSPSIEIKEELLEMERKGRRKAGAERERVCRWVGRE
jgi:methylated-DNA-[protein]-cysteine S-methyltransferase